MVDNPRGLSCVFKAGYTFQWKPRRSSTSRPDPKSSCRKNFSSGEKSEGSNRRKKATLRCYVNHVEERNEKYYVTTEVIKISETIG